MVMDVPKRTKQRLDRMERFKDIKYRLLRNEEEDV